MTYDYVLVAKLRDKEVKQRKQKAYLEKLKAKDLKVTVSPQPYGKLCNKDSC